MNFKNISTSKFDFLHFIKITLLEVLYCLTAYYCYAIFSMLLFGEGANSFMYTVTNGIIYLGLIILPPTIFNLYKFFKHSNGGMFSKSKNYFLTQSLLIIAFIWFVVIIAPVEF